MKRSTRSPSKIFHQVLADAENKLAMAANAAGSFQHRGIRGDERADALAQLLRQHLPKDFSIGKGEAIDYLDSRTGQLDLVIYDSATAAPLLTAGENLLLPAEALYAVIEVKSVLTQDELDACALAASKVRGLKPYKHKFSPTPTKGEAPNNCYRCPYIVFAFASNLSADNWAQKEFDRVRKSLIVAQGDLSLFDRVIVLDKGLIRPQISAARIRDEGSGIFLDFYIHLMNFLMKEKRRRPPIDMQAYVSTGKWIYLN